MEEIGTAASWVRRETRSRKCCLAGQGHDGADAYAALMVLQAPVNKAWLPFCSNPTYEHQILDKISHELYLGCFLENHTLDHATSSRAHGRFSGRVLIAIHRKVLPQFAGKGLGINQEIAKESMPVTFLNRVADRYECNEPSEHITSREDGLDRNAGPFWSSRERKPDCAAGDDKPCHALKEHAWVDDANGLIPVIVMTPASVHGVACLPCFAVLGSRASYPIAPLHTDRESYEKPDGMLEGWCANREYKHI